MATPAPTAAISPPSGVQGVGNPTSSLAAPARSQKEGGSSSFGTFGVKSGLAQMLKVCGYSFFPQTYR
jgi:pyridoxal 5'-phosphate synthase pdxS subunit